MGAFQDFCAEVPRWNQDVIDSNIGVILDTCRCDYVDELMTAVFIAHTKMLTAIRVSSKQKKLQITLPKLDHFLHRVFVECARAFWKAPFLFDTTLSPIEKQKNVLQAESMCTEALGGAVRSLLPVKNILRDYLNEDDDEASASAIAPVRSGGGGRKAAAAAAAAAEDDESSSDDSSSDDEAPTAAASAAPAAAPAPIETRIEKIETPSAIVGEPPTLSEYAVTTTIPAKSVMIEKVAAEATPAPQTVTAAAAAATPVVAIPTPAPAIAIVKEGEAPANPNPPKLTIETEPTVHFTPYDTVYDETTNAISEIRYTPKLSVEEKPPSTWGLMDDDEEEAPRIKISDGGDSLGLDDMVDLEAPAAPALPTKGPESSVAEDIDVPFGSTGDFEELA